jgi:hypothetical protein
MPQWYTYLARDRLNKPLKNFGGPDRDELMLLTLYKSHLQ